MLYYEHLFRGMHGMYDSINEPNLPALSLGRTVELMRVRGVYPWPYMPPTVCAAFGRILVSQNKRLQRDAVAFAATSWLHVPIRQSPTVVHYQLGLSPEVELHPTRPRKAPSYNYMCRKCPHEHGPAWWPRLSCVAIPLERIDAKHWLFAVPCVEHRYGPVFFEPTGISALTWAAAGLPLSWRFVVTSKDGMPRWGKTPTEALLEPESPPLHYSILYEGRDLWRGKLYPASVSLKTPNVKIAIQAPLYVPEYCLRDYEFMNMDAPIDRTHICWGQVLYGLAPDLFVREYWHTERTPRWWQDII
jgi:hypothetical protein